MGRFLGLHNARAGRWRTKNRLQEGDKRQFLTTMDPDVIRAIKQAALDLDRTASDVMEEAAKQWLERHKHKK
jgi:hypothetical protein